MPVIPVIRVLTAALYPVKTVGGAPSDIGKM